MIYVDTSLLVAMHVTERDSERALGWFARIAGAQLALSDWTELEFASALSRKMRSGTLSMDTRLLIDEAFSVTQASNFQRLEVGSADFTLAAAMVHRFQTGLRAGDALHLALAKRHGASLATLDRTLVAAAGEFGVVAEIVD
ncbi:PIN domain-containing protein [Arsenicitalea aurantiaca]|uniref:Ribonuclease VapC n=1 Tax=Arsenicitalea aurantiaca TaxID=1783274 RepID=A0A433XFK8_9HYPH|nr:type II toxin-antitoxin system VapC family toxin [Arsenicitalea aurantiaca]RUT32852.1 PIN domain-containing protein [Arsenicitalea aurantiaca]